MSAALRLCGSRKKKDKGVTGNIANLRNQKLKVAESQNRVKRSWAFLRKSSGISRNDENASGPSSDVSPSQQAEERSIISTAVPEVKRKAEKINNKLSIAGSTKTPHGPLGEELGGKIIDRRAAYSISPIHDPAMTGPSDEVTGTKRLSAHSRVDPRGSTKRTKKGDQGLAEPVLAPKESREKQLQRELDELKAKLRNQEDIAKRDEAKTAHYRQQSQNLQRDVEELSKQIQAAEQQKQEAEQQRQAAEQHRQAAEQLVQDYGKAIAEFGTIAKELEQENIHLKSALEGKEQILAEYRNDIVKLSNARPDSKRDDHYFEQNFSILFRSIDAWVLQYYLTLNPNLEDPTALHPLMQEFLTTTAGQEGLAILQHEPLFTTQAYVTAAIISRVLSPVLFGVQDDSFERLYKIIEPSADLEEFTKWRMSTVNMIIRRGESLNSISHKAEETATELVDSLAPLLVKSAKYKPGPRTKKLKAIVEQAAKLAWEIQQEPSIISYCAPEPSKPCVSSYVNDARGLKNDEELEAIGAVVRLTVHPAVIRRPFNSTDEIVLVKAKVLPLEPTDT